MIINIRIAGTDNPTAFRLLWTSLEDNQYIRDNARLKLKTTEQHMGLGINEIQLIVQTGFSLANLVLAFMEFHVKATERNVARDLHVDVGGETATLQLNDLDDQYQGAQMLVHAPNLQRSRCVLIGVAGYVHHDTLPELPAVRENLIQLEQALTALDVWGIPRERLRVISDPRSPEEIQDAIADAASHAPDTLLVYYAGHGLYDSGDGLLLALPEATGSDKSGTVRWSELADIISRADCERRVVWLDCCYAGLAVGGTQTPPPDLRGVAKVKNTYLLAASRQQAIPSDGGTCTAFTRELLRVLRGGIEPWPLHHEYLSLDAIHKQVRDALRSRGLPPPVKADPGRIGGLAHFHNNAPPPRTRTPLPHTKPNLGGLWNLLRRRPRWSVALSIVLVAVVVLAVVLPAQLGSSGRLVGGVDLAGYCNSQNLMPGGVSSNPPYCTKTVPLALACDWQNGQSNMTAVPAPGNPDGATCTVKGSQTTAGQQITGLSDLQEFCQVMVEAASSSAVNLAANVTQVADNANPNDRICQEPINMNDACDFSQRSLGLTNLVARQASNGTWGCYT